MIGDKYNTEALDVADLRVGGVVEEHCNSREGEWRLNLERLQESMQT
jgi:hypothetical protein|tara:strand:+ start:686 stop:826 length:141 start_codon:yes stop_codon:yes gene_type:complete